MWVSSATVLFAVVNAILVTVVLAVFGETSAVVASAAMGLGFMGAWLFYVATGRTYGMFLIGSGAAVVNNFAVHQPMPDRTTPPRMSAHIERASRREARSAGFHLWGAVVA